MRTLYRSLLWVHPPAFRKEFAGEMLWIFDETGAGVAIFCDAFTSLGRQWLLRTRAWTVMAALAGALLQVSIGGLGALIAWHGQIAAMTAADQFRGVWVGEERSSGKPMEIHLTRVGKSWDGEIVLGGVEHPGRDVRMEPGKLHIEADSLVLDGRRAPQGGRMSGTLEPFGAFRLTHQ